jgi:hypothetical protein
VFVAVIRAEHLMGKLTAPQRIVVKEGQCRNKFAEADYRKSVKPVPERREDHLASKCWSDLKHRREGLPIRST